MVPGLLHYDELYSCPACHIFVHCEAFAAETNKAVKTKKDGISKQNKQHGNKVGLPGKGLASLFVLLVLDKR